MRDAALLLADHLNDLVAVTDPSGPILYLNRAGRRLLNLAETAPLPADIAEFVDARDRVRMEEGRGVALGNSSWSGALRLCAGDGEAVPSRSTFVRLEVDDRVLIGWVARDTTADRGIIRALRERAFYDRRTGLPHRSLFLERLDSLLRDHPEVRPMALLLVTPDRFDEKIDRFSAHAGDQALRQVAARISTCVGNNSSVHRWVDENFVVLADGVESADEAVRVADSIQDGFTTPLVLDDREVYFTVSIGAALADDAPSSDQLLRHVDAANQFARRGDGGAIAVFDDDLRARTERRSQIDQALHGATDRGEMSLHYQPEIELRTGRMVACEALLRWDHPEWGRVSPAEFIPIAEAGGHMDDLGDWVVTEALRQSAAWARRFPERERCVVAVNISARQFAAEGFVERVRTRFAETGADPRAVCFEITESVLLDDADDTIATMTSLADLGVRLAIDDFGTGYSSLSYLRRFPAHILKVDQAFVNGLGHDPEDSAIVQAVVHMGRALGMTTVAEGVETAHHVIELRELDCDIAQGYHYSPPVPAAKFEEFLALDGPWVHR